MIGTTNLTTSVAERLGFLKINLQEVALSQLSEIILKPGQPVRVIAQDIINFSSNELEILDALVRRNPRVSLILSETNHNALTGLDIGNNILARAKKVDVMPDEASFTNSLQAA